MSSMGLSQQTTDHWTERQRAQHRLAEHYRVRAWVGRNPRPPMRQSKREFHRQVVIGDGRRENRKRLSMLSPAAARQLQEMSISVASGAETTWIRLLTVYCPD